MPLSRIAFAIVTASLLLASAVYAGYYVIYAIGLLRWRARIGRLGQAAETAGLDASPAAGGSPREAP